MLLRNLMLDSLDFVTHELNHLARLDNHHVVMVYAFVEFKYRMPTLEIMACYEARRLKLRQHPVNGSQPNILASLQQLLVDVFSTEVPGPALARPRSERRRACCERDF